LEAARLGSSLIVEIVLLNCGGEELARCERRKVVGVGMVDGEEPGFVCLKGAEEACRDPCHNSKL